MNTKYLLTLDGDLIKEFSCKKDALDFYEENIFCEKENAPEYMLNIETDGHSVCLCPYYVITNQPSVTYKQGLKMIDLLDKINNRLSLAMGDNK